MKMILGLAPLALALAACETYPDDPYYPQGPASYPEQPPYPPQPYPEPYPPQPYPPQPYPPSAALPPMPPEAPFGIAPPLERTRWRVLAINERPVPPGDYFIDFEDGRIAAKFGCNSLGATYTQTGSTLDAGPVGATKMACPDMGFESQGNRVLESVMNVVMLDRNRINLSSSAGTIELQRR